MYEYFALKKYMKSKVGFTLVELMIVIVVMSILVAVGVVLFGANTTNTAKQVCLENQRIWYSTLDTAITNEFSLDADTDYFNDFTEATKVKEINENKSYYFQVYHRIYMFNGVNVGEEIFLNSDYFVLFKGYSKNDSTNRKKLKQFLTTTFFQGELPHCPSATSKTVKTGTFNKKAYDCYFQDVIQVCFRYDDDGEPFIYSVQCFSKSGYANHGTGYKYK